MRRYLPFRLAGITAFALASSVAVAGAQQTQQPQQQQQQQQPNQQSDPAQQPITPVRLAQLEDEPQQYMGRRVSVSGEVEDVLGPRVFKIDERNWIDLERELLVVLDTPLAALVNEDDPVTVIGTVRRFVDVQFDREWGWIDLDPEVEARIRTRPVLVATSITGTNPDVGLTVSVVEPPQAAAGGKGTQPGTVGTSGRTAKGDSRPALTNTAELARATDTTHVGRRVSLSSVKVDRTANESGGFWVSADGEELFVLPANDTVKVQAGQTVTVEGHVLRLPRQMEDRIERSSKVGNEEVYVYATSIK